VKLHADRIDAGYDGRVILRALDLKVERGEIVTLVGPNGSGKSTVLRTLGRVLKPRAGSVLLDGKAISSLSTREVAQQMALLPQGPSLANDLTVQELVWMGRSPHQGILGLATKRDHEAVDWAVAETGVGDLLTRGMSTLSGGERQRAWIAMALAQKPDVLLLDEPTTFLDLNHELEVLDLVRYLNREHGITVVMVLHDLNQAARYATRVVVLNEGRVYAAGAPADVLTAATLRDVFGVEGQVMKGPDGVDLLIVPTGRVSRGPSHASAGAMAPVAGAGGRESGRRQGTPVTRTQ
jgi:ABC-type cobalamin/Fe3+-siderophores transport system ATPase subunit